MANAIPQAEIRSGMFIADDGTVYKGWYQIDHHRQIVVQIDSIVQKGNKPFIPSFGKIAIILIDQDQIADVENAQDA